MTSPFSHLLNSPGSQRNIPLFKQPSPGTGEPREIPGIGESHKTPIIHFPIWGHLETHLSDTFLPTIWGETHKTLWFTLSIFEEDQRDTPPYSHPPPQETKGHQSLLFTPHVWGYLERPLRTWGGLETSFLFSPFGGLSYSHLFPGNQGGP